MNNSKNMKNLIKLSQNELEFEKVLKDPYGLSNAFSYNTNGGGVNFEKINNIENFLTHNSSSVLDHPKEKQTIFWNLFEQVDDFESLKDEKSVDKIREYYRFILRILGANQTEIYLKNISSMLQNTKLNEIVFYTIFLERFFLMQNKDRDFGTKNFEKCLVLLGDKDFGYLQDYFLEIIKNNPSHVIIQQPTAMNNIFRNMLLLGVEKRSLQSLIEIVNDPTNIKVENGQKNIKLKNRMKIF